LGHGFRGLHSRLAASTALGLRRQNIMAGKVCDRGCSLQGGQEVERVRQRGCKKIQPPKDTHTPSVTYFLHVGPALKVSITSQ
jgi:hypothetical protein